MIFSYKLGSPIWRTHIQSFHNLSYVYFASIWQHSKFSPYLYIKYKNSTPIDIIPNTYEWQEFFVLPFTIHLLGCPTINTRISGVKGWVEPFTTLHLIGIVTKTSYTPRPPPAISTSFSSILANIFPGGLTPNTLSLHLTIPIEGKVKNNLFFHCPLTIKVLPQ